MCRACTANSPSITEYDGIRPGGTYWTSLSGSTKSFGLCPALRLVLRWRWRPPQSCGLPCCRSLGRRPGLDSGHMASTVGHGAPRRLFARMRACNCLQARVHATALPSLTQSITGNSWPRSFPVYPYYTPSIKYFEDSCADACLHVTRCLRPRTQTRTYTCGQSGGKGRSQRRSEACVAQTQAGGRVAMIRLQ